MKIVADVNGQNTPLVKSFQIYGATADMYKGDLVETGKLSVNDCGCVVPVASAAGPAEVLGLLTQFHDYSEDGEFTYNAVVTLAAQNLVVDVDIRPGAIYRSQVKESTNGFTTSAASATCTTTTANAAADEKGGSFVYDENDELHYVEDHSNTSELTYNTACVVAQAGVTSTCVWIPQRLYGASAGQGLTYTKATSTTLDSSVLLKADESVLWVLTLDCFYQEAGKDIMRLLPKDDMRSLTSPKFYIDFIIRDHMLNPLS